MNSTDASPAAPNATWAPPGGPAGNGTAAPREGLLHHAPVHAATLAACASLLALVFCLGSYGNVVVFLSFFDPAFRKLRTDFDFMVLNLSFCDLFLCGVTAPMFALALFLGSVPDAFCFTFHLTGSGFILMSLKTVAVIALHRLRMVLGRQPDHRAAPFPCTLLLALLLWASSFALAALATLQTRPALLCLPVSSLAAGEGKAVLSLYVADFTFCVAVVSVSYVLIAQALRRNAQVRRCVPPVGVTAVDARRPQPFVGAPGKGGREEDPVVQGPGPALYRNQHSHKLQQAQAQAQAHGYAPGPHPLQLVSTATVNLSAAKDSKAVVTCVVIVLSVLACCLPLGIALVQVVLSGRGGFVLYQFELCGFTLIFLKSGLNPFIYSRNSTGLRRKVLWCLQHAGLGLSCCQHKTRLRAMGKGNLEVNRNKSSHHETNSAYMLSPKAQKRFVDQACGPSHSKESVASPKFSAGHQHCGQSSSTPIHTRMEPYYSIYNSSPSQDAQPVHAFGFAGSYVATHYHTTNDLLQECDSAPARRIPVPSV